MARPRIKLTLISSFLDDRGGATAREVAYGLQLSIPDASHRLHYMQRRGEVRIRGFETVEHAKRPVAVFEPVDPSRRSAIFSDDWLRS
jgi:hypothetical protein